MLDVETDAYIHCVSAFVKLAQSEYQLLVEVIPEHHQKKTFDSLIQVLPRPGPYRAVTAACVCSLQYSHLLPSSWASVLAVCLVGTSHQKRTASLHPSGRPHRPWEPALASAP